MAWIAYFICFTFRASLAALQKSDFQTYMFVLNGFTVAVALKAWILRSDYRLEWSWVFSALATLMLLSSWTVTLLYSAFTTSPPLPSLLAPLIPSTQFSTQWGTLTTTLPLNPHNLMTRQMLHPLLPMSCQTLPCLLFMILSPPPHLKASRRPVAGGPKMRSHCFLIISKKTAFWQLQGALAWKSWILTRLVPWSSQRMSLNAITNGGVYVSLSLSAFMTNYIYILQLYATYKAVSQWNKKSGSGSWHNEYGVNVWIPAEREWEICKDAKGKIYSLFLIWLIYWHRRQLPYYVGQHDLSSPHPYVREHTWHNH